MQSAQALLVTALAHTTAAMVIRPTPHPPHHLTELAMAMGRITAATAIHPTAMLATAIRLMAMAAIALPAGWRSIGPVGAKGVGHTDRPASASPWLLTAGGSPTEMVTNFSPPTRS